MLFPQDSAQPSHAISRFRIGLVWSCNQGISKKTRFECEYLGFWLPWLQRMSRQPKGPAGGKPLRICSSVNAILGAIGDGIASQGDAGSDRPSDRILTCAID